MTNAEHKFEELTPDEMEQVGGGAFFAIAIGGGWLIKAIYTAVAAGAAVATLADNNS